jgi:tetratricopeptide (TPR) repeat protein
MPSDIQERRYAAELYMSRRIYKNSDGFPQYAKRLPVSNSQYNPAQSEGESNMARLLSSFIVCIALCGVAFAQHEHHNEGSVPEKLGTVNFPNTCSPAVQSSFMRSVALLHSFWYDEAERQFLKVADLDSKCAIAWWGAGMSGWHLLWEPNGPNPERLKQGKQWMDTARAVGARSERENGFIAALSKFYDNSDKAPHLERALAYEQAMSDLHAKFPSDHETTIFYALSLLGSAGSSAPDKTYARQRKAGAMLEPLVALEPDHPGIEHYIIHSYDYPALAPQALKAARRYSKIAPDAPHALHMPSHIFTRLGYWQDSIDSNLASASAARKHGLIGDELHALDYLEFAYLQTAQDKPAEEIAKQALTPTAADAARFAGTFANATIPVRYAIERRQWAEAAALPATNLQGGRYAWADATIYYGRALGAARAGKVEQARAEVAKIADCKQALLEAKEAYWSTQVEIQRLAAEAWTLFASGKQADALAEMRSAVALDDSTDKHPVTPGAVVPMRVLLGDMLLELKRPEEAQLEFTKSLQSEPNRFAAIYGAARSAEMKGDSSSAIEMYQKLIKLAAQGNQDRPELKRAKQYLATKASAD